MPITVLAAQIGWERSRVSHHVRRMSARGLVTCGLSAADRRVTEVTLTARGRQALEEAAPGHVLPPLAQVALEEGETVARNLDAEVKGSPLEEFTFHDKGFVVSVGTRRGVADIAGLTTSGRLAHLLKDAIEWEYRQSVTHLRGWDPVAM